MDINTPTPATPDKQVTVPVPEDRVAEFYAFYARFLAGRPGRRRGRGRPSAGHGPGHHRCGGHEPHHASGASAAGPPVA